AWTQARGFCALGSLKGNLGHLDAAAGVAGLIKAALMLHHGRIAPTINVSEPNPALQLETSPFYLPRAPVAWTGPGRHAAVSSLGIGGTNVHLILAAAPEVQPQAEPILEPEPLVEPVLLPVSAPSAEAFARLSQALADRIETPPGDGLAFVDLPDLALTLQRGRQPFAWRGAVIAGDRSEAAARLRSLVPQQGRTLPPLVFLCPGLGSQQPMMGAALWPVWPAYRAAIADCVRILVDCWPHDLVSLLLEAHPPEFLAEPLIMQPLIFCHGYALARGWMELGLQPAALLGHSFGEYLAATLAGSASLAQILPLIVKRGELFAQLTGAVLGVAADPDKLELPPGISLASVNGPERLTLSGPRPELEAFARAGGVSVRWLDVPHAVHHPLLDAILAPLERAAAAVSWQAPRLRLLSGLNGHWQQDAPAAGYWARQARQTIRFDTCLQTLADQGSWLGLELGPGKGLAGLCRGRGLTAFGGSQDLAGFWRILAGLWELGAAPRWEALEVPGRRIPLPGTPLTRQRHWIPAGDPAPVLPSGRLPFDDWFRVPLWRRSLLPGRSKGAWALLPQAESELSTLPSTLVLPCLEIASYEQATAAFLDLRARVLALVMAGWPQGGRGQLVLLTPPFSRVTGDEALSPWPALLLGLVRTLALEFPGLSARLVESDSGRDLPAGEWLQPEAHVAWRNGMRWLPELMAVPRPEPVSDPAGPLKNGGVYVITGASGGLGRSFAAWLQQRYQARLVLLSRTPPPDAPDTLPLAVDMRNPEQVRAALATAGAYFGRIDGILHAAAEPGHHLLASLGASEWHQTLDAKVLGAVHLQQALDTLGLEPDFVLLCSALATQLGSPGQSAYAAANAWLEAFAQQQAGPWMAVAWGSWQQLGMAARALQNLPEAWQPLYRPFLELGIDPKQGCLALERALQLAQTQLVVSPVAIAELAGLQQQALAAARRSPLQRAGSPSSPRAAVPTAELPRLGLETLIAGVWEQCLGLAPGRQDHFAALGGDSLSAVQMKALLEQALGQELPLGLFLQDLSLSALAASLVDGTPPSADLLIRLNSPESGDPLFFVHAISGTVFPYRSLADSLQRPFYGLQSRGLLGSDNLPHSDLGAMARDYLGLIETAAQPPYVLGGWSFGALVAWEMARQCLARGQSVKRLILLDMQAPEPGQALDEGGLRERFEADLTGLGPAAGRMRDRLWLIFEAHVRATQTFRPEVLDVPALLLVAEKGFGATHVRRDLGWGRWLPQLEVVRIPGDHYSCLDAPNLAQWSARLDNL
ncbi:MAG: SDR family NAD(P)-dependent oxidoreductase, partial [Candidatus Sericytochromatia bacterium]